MGCDETYFGDGRPSKEQEAEKERRINAAQKYMCELILGSKAPISFSDISNLLNKNFPDVFQVDLQVLLLVDPSSKHFTFNKKAVEGRYKALL